MWTSFLCLTRSRRANIRSSHPSLGGDSGMKTQSAPDARADTKARYLEQQHRVKDKSFGNQCRSVKESESGQNGTHPQCRPMTSRTKVRWWL